MKGKEELVNIGRDFHEETIKMKNVEVKVPCDGNQRKYGQVCIRLDSVEELMCVAEEAGGKYRVQLKMHEKATFTCMKFQKHETEEVVQIYQAIPKDVNEDRLCHDSSMQRVDWPWIGSSSPEKWHPCPLVGGFDFGLYFKDTIQRECEEIWRPSRMESECIKGEGLNFYFPEKRCSPFYDKKLDYNFSCFASWSEASYMFILFGELNEYPRYTLRLPIDIKLHDESVGHLYFSPVTPLSSVQSVDYAQLSMLRSEPGVCFDESDQCRQFAMEGKCTNQALHHYANHCKKSCGLCEYAPSERAECKYPKQLQGDWVMFNEQEREEITLQEHAMRFSTLGSFICKSKHWEYDYYKTLTVFDDGCRPRYSCLHLTRRENEKVMHFQLSHSTFTDESFALCVFRDDPKPLGDRIRSKKSKIVLPIESMFLGSCGLRGMVAVQAHYADGTTCIGEMSDVNPFTCDTRSSLTLSLLNNCNYRGKFVYQCSALTKLSDTTDILVTSLAEEGHLKAYVCWIVDMFTDLNAPKGHLGKYIQARCDTGERYYSPPERSFITSLSLNKDFDKPCSGIQDDGGGGIRNTFHEPPSDNIPPPINAIVVSFNMSSSPKSRILRKEEREEADKHSDTPVTDVQDTEAGDRLGTINHSPNAHVLPSSEASHPCCPLAVWILFLAMWTL